MWTSPQRHAPFTRVGKVPMRILLVEDDPMIGESVRDGLRAEHYAVDWVYDGNAAKEALARQGYDLILLDLGLPKRDGLEVLAAYRQRGGDAPILVTTARGELDYRIRGLDAGADDYLVKPFDLDEMYARVRALLRRRRARPGPHAQGAGPETTAPAERSALLPPTAPAAGLPWAQPRAMSGGPTVECRGLMFKPVTGEISFKGSPLRLSVREYTVLRALLDPPGVIVSRKRMDALLVKADPAAGGSADREVFLLRNKFGNDFIRNVSGAGYMIAAGR